MLKKLLKYNLKNQFKFFGVLYGFILLSAIIARLLGSWADAPVIIIVVKDFFEGVMWAMIANIFVNNVIRIWAEFQRSMYGDESYLMHTLPVKSSALYWSKFFTAAIVLAANVAVTSMGLLILYARPGFFEWINNFLTVFAGSMHLSPIIYGVLLGAILLFEIFNVVIVGFFAVILGHKKDNNKTLWSLGFGLLTYFLTQIIVIAVFAISGIFKSEMFGLFTGSGSSFDSSTILTLIIESCITYLVLIVSLGLVSARTLSCGFDID